MADEKSQAKAQREADKEIVKDQIAQQMEQAKELHKQKLLRRRLELARQGSQNYEMMKLADAARAYHTYLQVLEEWKGVREGQLHPGLFDKQEELTELVLISGVYWDLAAIFDRTKGRHKYAEFRHYLDKFVLFSFGMPFHPVATETLRKYIANGKTIHKSDYKRAYGKLETEKCFIVTSLVDHCDPSSLVVLRGFRDKKLLQSFLGRELVRAYYFFGPWLAKVLNLMPDRVREVVARSVDQIASKVRNWNE